MGVKVGTGVGVRVMVGEGVSVSLGGAVGVLVGLAGDRPGRVQACRMSTNAKMERSNFFMQRTIHGRGRGVKVGMADGNG